MRIRFQADADLNQLIVAAMLRHLPEVDFRSATDAGLAGLDDLEVLARAARDGRVLVTHDKNTMPGYFDEVLDVVGQRVELLDDPAREDEAEATPALQRQPSLFLTSS